MPSTPRPPTSPSKPPLHAQPTTSFKPPTRRARPTANPNWDEEGFSGYMRAKNAKLRAQFAEQYTKNDASKKTSSKPTSSVLSGVVIWVDGHTTPSRLALRDLVGRHGGSLETYFSTDLVTHVVAENLAAATRKRFSEMKKRRFKIVTPKWLTDSVEKGRKLPERLYQVPGMADPAQKSLTQMFKKKPKRKT